MENELLSKVGEGKTGLARLEFMVTYLENSKRSLSPNTDLSPIIDLVRHYEQSPNLALPLVMSGLGMEVEEGKICVSKPEIFESIVEVTQHPLSPELQNLTTQFVMKALDRLIVQLLRDKQFTPNFAGLEDLTIGEYPDRMRAEQPEVRKLFVGYAKDHSDSPVPLDKLLQRLQGKQVELKPQVKAFPEPRAERVEQIKELCRQLGIDVIRFNATPRGLEIEFSQAKILPKLERSEELLRLFKNVLGDWGEYYQWKAQKEITFVYDLDNLEAYFFEKGANTPFSEVKRSQSGLVISLEYSDYKKRGMAIGVINNPSMNIGSMEGKSVDKQVPVMNEYLQRFGEIREKDNAFVVNV